MSSEFVTTDPFDCAQDRFHRFSQIYTDFIDNWDEGGMQETGDRRGTMDDGRGTRDEGATNPKS
jgi:hypothetical protein